MDSPAWKSCYDAPLWACDGLLHLFVQQVGQGADDVLEVDPRPLG